MPNSINKNRNPPRNSFADWMDNKDKRATRSGITSQMECKLFLFYFRGC